MVLLPVPAPLPVAATLPTWAYTYELPATPTILVRGTIYPSSGMGSGGGGFGGGSVETPPAPVPLRLTDLVPEIARGKGPAIGERLDRVYIDRAKKSPDAPYFTTTVGTALVGYSLDATNRIQGATYFVTVTPAESEARFAAIRARLDRQLGPPSYGRREGDASLTLVWRQPDATTAAIGLTAGEGSLGLTVLLADGTQPAPGQ